MPSEKCKLLREKGLELARIARNYERMEKDMDILKSNFDTLKLENAELDNNLNRASEQRDLAKREIGDMCINKRAFKAEQDNLNEQLKGWFKYDCERI